MLQDITEAGRDQLMERMKMQLLKTGPLAAAVATVTVALPVKLALTDAETLAEASVDCVGVTLRPVVGEAEADGDTVAGTLREGVRLSPAVTLADGEAEAGTLALRDADAATDGVGVTESPRVGLTELDAVRERLGETLSPVVALTDVDGLADSDAGEAATDALALTDAPIDAANDTEGVGVALASGLPDVCTTEMTNGCVPPAAPAEPVTWLQIMFDKMTKEEDRLALPAAGVA